MRPPAGENRIAWIGLAIALAISATWLLLAGRGLTFHGDEILYYANLVNKDGVISPLYGLEYLFAPHNGHLVLLGRLAYEGLFTVAGSDYGVFRGAEVLGVLSCAVLFFILAARRTAPLVALALSIVLAFFGYANETLMWPFDLHTVYSAALGLGAFLALEREDRRGDVVGCVLLTLSVLMLEVGLAFAVGVGVLVLLRPDRRRRLWIFLLPLALYAVWWLWAAHFDQPSEVLFSNVRLVPSELVNALAAIFGCLLGLNPTGAEARPEVVGVTAAGTVAAGFALAGLVYRVRKGDVPPTLWAFLATVVAYWLTMAAGGRPPDSTRYVFVGAVLVLLVVVDALRGVRFGPLGIAAFFVVVALAIPSHVQKLYDGRNPELEVSRVTGSEYAMLDLLGPGEVDPGFVPASDPRVSDAGGALFVPLSAGNYFDAAERNGTLGMSLAELRGGDPKYGAIADATLVGALGLETESTEAPTGYRSCPAVTDATKENLAYFELEAGGVILGNRGDEDLTVGLSRFGPDAPGASVGTLEPGGWAEVRIPPDSIPDPWRAVVDGPVSVCPLP